jgi:hypothetical protein
MKIVKRYTMLSVVEMEHKIGSIKKYNLHALSSKNTQLFIDL